MISSFCAHGGCVDVEFIGDDVCVSSTVTPGAGVLVFSHDEWAAFLAGVKAGEFDLPPVAAAA